MADAETLMAAMQGRAEALKRLGYRIRFDLTDTEESVLLDATGGTAAIGPADAATEADTVLSMSGENLAKLLAGRLSPMLAFSTGKLRVEGSKGVAMKLASLLDD
ncbi:SCP2 sterol-binding domain-containing protein [Paracraurococcus ruber]|uniref:Sterol-binding protein n=1 Tax=Paracraurococcus ruber TaxID=77675 RepID=A0ABS1CW95_9PROT|nr:SCP2 sterol-binding domain-containing protein [Paracraurococcus ruber]MBK1658648.1 sterol-binding protein [Paracraurococcus ruber]TDG29614.1 SCP2 sterol-binding domain-containing protein [Paracraurococcus ruber]